MTIPHLAQVILNNSTAISICNNHNDLVLDCISGAPTFEVSALTQEIRDKKMKSLNELIENTRLLFKLAQAELNATISPRGQYVAVIKVSNTEPRKEYEQREMAAICSETNLEYPNVSDLTEAFNHLQKIRA